MAQHKAPSCPTTVEMARSFQGFPTNLQKETSRFIFCAFPARGMPPWLPSFSPAPLSSRIGSSFLGFSANLPLYSRPFLWLVDLLHNRQYSRREYNTAVLFLFLGLQWYQWQATGRRHSPAVPLHPGHRLRCASPSSHFCVRRNRSSHGECQLRSFSFLRSGSRFPLPIEAERRTVSY